MKHIGKILILSLFFYTIPLFSLSEPSGVTWNPLTGNFYVVGDEGIIYEVDHEGNEIRSAYIGSYDLEAVTYNSDRNSIFCLDEKRISLLELELEDFTPVNIFQIKFKRKKLDKYQQFESLAYVPSSDSCDGFFYFACSVEDKKNKSGLLFSVSLEELKPVKVVELPLWDISGLSYFDNSLYMVSDDEDVIANYSFSTERLIVKDLRGEHQEGVVYTSEGDLFFMEETGSLEKLPVDLFSTD